MRPLVLMASGLLLLATAGCSEATADPPTSTPRSTAAASPSPSASPTVTKPRSSADLVVAPGTIGAATVGMTVKEAAATGLFNRNVKRKNCWGATFPLAWKKQFAGADVAVYKRTVVSLSSFSKKGPRTADGLGVGSTVGELIEQYGGDLKPVENVGYGQVGMFVKEGDAWLGFLIGKATKISDTDDDPGLKVTFVELGKGKRPDLMRDGC